MSNVSKLAAIAAAAEEFLAADDACAASYAQRSRAPDHSERCMRRYNARAALRALVLDHNAEVADRKIGRF